MAYYKGTDIGSAVEDKLLNTKLFSNFECHNHLEKMRTVHVLPATSSSSHVHIGMTYAL